jgi:hypothetical protein
MFPPGTATETETFAYDGADPCHDHMDVVWNSSAGLSTERRALFNRDDCDPLQVDHDRNRDGSYEWTEVYEYDATGHLLVIDQTPLPGESDPYQWTHQWMGDLLLSRDGHLLDNLYTADDWREVRFYDCPDPIPMP